MKTTSILALSALMTIGANAQITLTNANFESNTHDSPTVTSGAYALGTAEATAPGWTRSGGQAHYSFNTASNVFFNTNLVSMGGTKTYGMKLINTVPAQTSGTLSQSGLSGTANFYSISVDYRVRNLQAVDLAVIWNGTTLGQTGFKTSNDGIVTFTTTFYEAADFTNRTLSFQGTTNSADATIALDNIVISVIPEPSAALLGAFGALALLRRRR